ncbi:hypothetical protein FS837_000193 [Tulasnella sp. UAMH 9824]|nr:hypothetical protein FS837_000193 [Tulasnella sp. UAMH 9824]
MTLGKKFANPDRDENLRSHQRNPTVRLVQPASFNKPSTFPTLSALHASSEETCSAQDLTADPIPAEDPALTSSRQDEKNSIRTPNLATAKRTFQSIRDISGALPIVGTYAGVVAKVGLAVVQVAETMQENQDIAKGLKVGISKLSQIVKEFEARSDKQPGDEITAQIQEMKKEIERLQKRVQKWGSSGLLPNTSLATDQREALNECINTVYKALVQLQVSKTVEVPRQVEYIDTLSQVIDRIKFTGLLR